MKKALIFEGSVVDVVTEVFPVSTAMHWVDAPDDAEIGWVEVNGLLSPPVVPTLTLQEAKARKLSELSALRYQREIAGVVWGEQSISTDDRAKTLLAGARTAADAALSQGQPYEINWKIAGGWVVIDAATIVALSDLVRGFVQACFDTEKFHYYEIMTLPTVSEVMEYDLTTGWPA